MTSTRDGLVRRLLSLTVAGLTALAVSLVTPDAHALLGTDQPGHRFTSTEKCFMHKINYRRTNHGRRPLSWDHDVGIVARRHAAQIAGDRTVRHDYNYDEEITRWRRLGQNTGRGEGCRSLFRAFWRSETHRHNILGRWRHMGVGVWRQDGAVYVQQVFESRRNPGSIYS